jgi:hypothetical protein
MRRREFVGSCLAAGALRAVPAVAAPKAATRRILYVYGQVPQPEPAVHATVEALGNSGFNVLILSFLRVFLNDGRLELRYNDTPFSELNATLARVVRRLQTGFAGRKRVLLCLGGWAQLGAFDAVRKFGVPRFIAQLDREVIAPLGIDGLDLDLEPMTGGLPEWMAVHHEYGKTVVDITNAYKRTNPTHVVTHAPISSVAADLYATPAPLPGLPQGMLAATRTAQGNNIDWLNVQLYEGGAVTGMTIPDFYRTRLVTPLEASQAASGIRRPLHFFTPLFEPHAEQPLEFCRKTIRAIGKCCAGPQAAGGVDGVALWEYGQIASAINTWSSGLQGVLRT